MIGAPISPFRALALAAHAVSIAEEALTDRTDSLVDGARHLAESVEMGSTLNSLGEIQGKAAMVDAAVGRVVAARDAFELIARTVIGAEGAPTDEIPVSANPTDVELLRTAFASSEWLRRSGEAFLADGWLP